MSSLTRVTLTQGQWGEISGEMVSGEKYRLINGYPENVVVIAESASTPTSTTSGFPLSGLQSITWKYDGTKIWARPRVIDRAATLGVDIILVAES